jgi:hypothetical protein
VHGVVRRRPLHGVLRDGPRVANAGTFYFDGAANKLYVHLADGGNPATHTIEVSVRRRVLWLGLASQYMCVEGLTVHHSNGSGVAGVQQESGVFIGARSVIANSIIEHMDFAGLALGYNHDSVRASYVIVRNNGGAGMGAAGTTNVVVEHAQVRNNNQRKFNVFWHSGGIKLAAPATKGVVRDSVFERNIGPGVWCDYCGGGDFRVQRNLLIGNTRESQIFIEVTPNATVENNLILSDDAGGRAIFIRESASARVLFNTIVRSTGSTGIDVFGGPRGSANNATILGNIIVSYATTGTSTELRIGSATGTAGITGTKSNNNLMFNANGKYAFTYGATVTTLADWQKLGFDSDSLVADPQFVDRAALDYTLAKGAPAVDRLVAPEVTNDHDGSARPKGPKSDLGAFERCSD